MAKLSLKDVSNDVQYQVVAARRQNYDNLLWQTPVISLTGQAFLFTIALGSGSKLSRIIASLLALIAALASSQPLARHRHFEVYYSKLLESVELEMKLQAVHERPREVGGTTGWSSYVVWQVVFWVFALAAIAAGVLALLDA